MWCVMQLNIQNIGAQSLQELFFCDRSIRRTVNSNDLVKFFWVAMYSKKETGHAHGIGVHSLIIYKCPTFTQIFLLWTECKQKQLQS